MSLSNNEILAIVHELQPHLQHAKLIGFHAIGLRQFVIGFQQGQNKGNVFLGFQEPFLRLHFWNGHDSWVASAFATAVQATLLNAEIMKIEMLNQDRIVQMTLRQKQQTYYLIGEFFPKRPNLYVMNDKREILKTLNPSSQHTYELPTKVCPDIPQLTNLVSSASIESKYLELERTKTLADAEHVLKQTLNKACKLYQKAQENYNNALAWRNMQHEGILLQANLYRLQAGMTSIQVTDWEMANAERTLKIDPRLKPHEIIENRFKQSKKLKAAIGHAEERLVKTKGAIEQVELAIQNILKATSIAEINSLTAPFTSTKRKNPTLASLPYRIFYTESGLKIWVGKNARGNDQLTFGHAKGNDWWFHVTGSPGSHVILRANKNHEPDYEAIQDAVTLSIAFSKSRAEGVVEVLVSQCKYVSKIGLNKAGQVQVSKHKTMFSTFDLDRFERIKKRFKEKEFGLQDSF